MRTQAELAIPAAAPIQERWGARFISMGGGYRGAGLATHLALSLWKFVAKYSDLFRGLSERL